MENIKFIGHRGNQGCARENSYESILDCSIFDCIDGTEFDIRPTKDDKVVVIHNGNIGGNTCSRGKICNLNYDDLKGLQFHTSMVDVFLQKLFNFGNDDKYFYEQYCLLSKQSSFIPTLSSIMEHFSYDKHMLIELKGLLGEYSDLQQKRFEDNVVGILKDFDYAHRDICLEGYNLDALYRIKNRLPDLRVIALINKHGSLSPLDMDFDGVSLEHVLINDGVISKVIDKKMKLYSWDDKTPIKHYSHIVSILRDYKREIDLGLLPLYVINDFPEKAKEYVFKKFN